MDRPTDSSRDEVSGAVLLLAAAVVALVWANSGWRSSYASLWHIDATLTIGGHDLGGDLRHWVNEALMTVFFLVVGMEIKRETVTGALRDRRTAALPAVAALGGMAVPALVFLAFTVGGPGSRGWGIPMATDIAFAMGVAGVLGRRVPASLKLFLLTLAVVDDVGAILVIGLFYGSGLRPAFLALALLLAVAVVTVRRGGVVRLAPYMLLGAALWLAVGASGVHATIAGVVLGLLVPASSADRLTRHVQPWSRFLILPVFALANAGVALSARAFDAPGAPAVAAGVMLGLVAGKTMGIVGASWLAVRSGLGRLPEGATWPMMLGVAAIGGVGFTVSLFMAELAFVPGPLPDAAKVGILAGSAVAALFGSAVLLWTHRRTVDQR